MHPFGLKKAKNIYCQYIYKEAPGKQIFFYKI